MIKDILQYIYKLVLLICYQIISFLVDVTNGNKKLVIYKVALGILLLTINNSIYSQSDTIKVKSISIEKDTIITIDEVIVTGYAITKRIETTCYSTISWDEAQSAYSYVQKHIVYPRKALKNKIEGIVKVQFTIRKKGKIKNIKILDSLGYGCDKEVVQQLRRYNWFYHNKPKLGKKSDEIMSIEFKLPEK
jgi:TonB family protein